MSNFVVAVGGSGAKLMQTLIHLGASGLMPQSRRELFALLVDPDENNGNVEECQSLARTYRGCREELRLGATDLLSGALSLQGPWTPLQSGQTDSLREIFHYDKLDRAGSIEAELLDLFFEKGELSMSIKQGFRGRPAIGATVLGNAVNFKEEPWSELTDRIRARDAQGSVNVLLAGSVFGGAGASGVPTIVRLLEAQLADNLANLRLGLVLFLPFFQFRPVEGEEIQADPSAFPMATAEALKYYHERGFLAFCHSIFAVGEEIPADMAISAVGASEQRNEPHFVELIAGMGAMRFFNDQLSSRPSTLNVASRKEEQTVTWDDLPYDEHEGQGMVRKFQSMVVFAVAYRFIFFPVIATALSQGGKSNAHFWQNNITGPKVNPDVAGRALRDLNEYIGRYLAWLMHISTPRREAFHPGMVNPNVFAVKESGTWRLKSASEFRDRDFGELLLNRPAHARLDSRAIYQKADRAVSDANAVGAGRLVRALYDACLID